MNLSGNLEVKIVVPPTPFDDAKKVRKEVFQIEQGIGENLDFDGNDDSSVHVVAYKGNVPIGAGRIRYSENKERAKIERVAVLPSFRGKGIGKLIMSTIENYLIRSGTKEVYLDAQLTAREFYEKLGYVQEGEAFQEAGIPHVKMLKHL